MSSSFFLLHDDVEREFGLRDALLNFVMSSQLPTEQLYDALVVVLQRKDKEYEDILASIPTTHVAQVKAIEQLIQHERQICRRIIVGLMSLEEGSELSDTEDF
ncbi:hypothetical protein PsorP6_008314 [Peronosclerospora sorghi]|uniref:Uncharacterized protein n=1 Tax=Peronosclerospora sorghi TaxID=230839 RepID=A0ACC0W6C9_9STRA|nr:hypothetical protein PsorP6_008314 [Peronosclerospora sorghi]